MSLGIRNATTPMNVHILYIEIELHVPYSQSLKDKRQVVTRFKDRIRNQYNVSIAEVGHLDDWQRAGFALSMVGNARAVLEKQANSLATFAQEIVDAEVIAFERQWL